MYDYTSDEKHDPPAPVITIKVRRPDNTDKYYEEQALIDTGAFKSCITKNIIDELVLIKMSVVTVGGYKETDYEEIDTYGAQIKLDGLFDDLVEVIELPNHAESIIGRDIINKLNILLEGKNKKFEISVPE